MRRLLLLLAILVPLGACAAAQAKTPVERPNLEVPPPPPRVIEPVTASDPPAPEPVADLPAPPANPRPRPPQRDTGKQEPPKTDLPPVEQPPAAPPAAVAPPPQLRMPSTPDAAQAERMVRDIMNRAFATLQSIDWRKLKPEQRLQYDNAKLMLNQAEEGIKAANFDFARNLAEKAERIAKELLGR